MLTTAVEATVDISNKKHVTAALMSMSACHKKCKLKMAAIALLAVADLPLYKKLLYVHV